MSFVSMSYGENAARQKENGGARRFRTGRISRLLIALIALQSMLR
jgi:hypothetical protein